MKLRIGVTRREYLTNVDGVNRFLFTLADGLSVLGHEVHVLSYSFKGCTRAELPAHLKNFFGIENPVEIHTLTSKSRPEIWPVVASAWFSTGSKLINQLDLDAIILNGVVPINADVCKIAVNHGFQTGVFPKLRGFRRQLYLGFVKYLYRYSMTGIVCVSPQLKKEFKAVVGLDSMLVPLPVKLNLFKGCSTRENQIIHMGTRPGKNLEVSIKAIKMLAEKTNNDVKLVIVGSRNSHVEKLAYKYKDIVPKNLQFVFNADIFNIAHLLAHGKALILPSKYEALPYAVLEALGSGLPAVVSESIPNELVTDGCEGFRVSGFEPASYFKALANLVEDENLWKKMSKCAVEKAAHYSYTKVAKRYEDIICHLS